MKKLVALACALASLLLTPSGATAQERHSYTHADTLRILQLLNLEDRVRLTTEHFMVLPAIVRATDLAVVMPRNIARGFAGEGGHAIVEPPFPLRDFTVSLHWSKRFEADPGNRWLRQVITALFSEKAS